MPEPRARSVARFNRTKETQLVRTAASTVTNPMHTPRSAPGHVPTVSARNHLRRLRHETRLLPRRPSAWPCDPFSKRSHRAVPAPGPPGARRFSRGRTSLPFRGDRSSAVPGELTQRERLAVGEFVQHLLTKDALTFKPLGAEPGLWRRQRMDVHGHEVHVPGRWPSARNRLGTGRSGRRGSPPIGRGRW